MNRKERNTATRALGRHTPASSRRAKLFNSPLYQQPEEGQEDISDERIQSIRRVTRHVSKKSVARKSPLRFEYSRKSFHVKINQEDKKALRKVIDHELTDQERLREVFRQIERTKALPKASAYARHKLQVLEKARSLLEKRISSDAHVDTEGDELNRLLQELSIK